VRSPRFGWQLRSSARGVRQTAYQVRVAQSGADLRAGRRLTWDSGRVASDASAHVAYGGPPLQSRETRYWQVRVWDGGANPSPWSEIASWETGLLAPSDWTAAWIEPGLEEDVKVPGPSPLMRREFQLEGVVRRARAYVTSHGLYVMTLNGRRVGDELFTPGWTSYNKRLQYRPTTLRRCVKWGRTRSA
jgi:alpha-L-rhamnosidase